MVEAAGVGLAPGGEFGLLAIVVLKRRQAFDDEVETLVEGRELPPALIVESFWVACCRVLPQGLYLILQGGNFGLESVELALEGTPGRVAASR